MDKHAEEIWLRLLESPPEGLSMDPVNLVDAVVNLRYPLSAIANAITPHNTIPGHDEAGGNVGSLTEAVMGITSAGFAIARAIDALADAVEKEAL